MKSLIFGTLIFLMTFVLFAGTFEVAPKNQREHGDEFDQEMIRVMTFNIRLDTPSDGPNAWPHRKEMVARTMRFHKTDFVGIQEGLPHQMKKLDELLPHFDRIGVGRNGSEEDEGEYSAIFYRKDRFEMLESDTFWLSETPNEPGSIGWDAMFPRIVTWGNFSDRSTGRNFFIFNTHFDHRGEEARAESARLILEKIEEIAGESPVVLTGDFNVTEDQQPYEVLTDSAIGELDVKLSDGFYSAEYSHHGPTSTWNGFEEIEPDRRIDYIFVNSGFDVVHHAILADHQDGRFPSDHLPVVADLVFAN